MRILHDVVGGAKARLVRLVEDAIDAEGDLVAEALQIVPVQ